MCLGWKDEFICLQFKVSLAVKELLNAGKVFALVVVEQLVPGCTTMLVRRGDFILPRGYDLLRHEIVIALRQKSL